MNTKYIALGAIVMLLLASCTPKEELTNSQTNTATEVNTAEDVTVASNTEGLIAYSEYNGEDLSGVGKQTVLFFHQASCGTCVKTDKDIMSQSELPDNLNIIKVDFDTETELNAKYGVTTKHTFVLIDENGKMLAKEIGLATTADIAAFANNGAGSQTAIDESETMSDSEGPTGYTEYTGQDLTALGEETVLFFFQESCGTCQKTHADIMSQSSLPNGLKIIKVDFDTETELNRQYDVTTKHTFVLVDGNGNMIAKEIGLSLTSDIADFATENSATASVVVTEAVVAQVVEEAAPAPIVAASSKGEYKEYTGTIDTQSVLFFAAAWCPSCVAADKNFSAENELAIDADILKVDYDNSADLKAKYGVNTQHTFVLVDADGNMIKKMAGGTKSSDLTALFN